MLTDINVVSTTAPTLRAFRLGSRGKAGAQQEEPSLEEGSGSLQTATPLPGPEYAKASILLF
jgi:hypothetical protein